MPEIFMSYSREDSSAAEAFARELGKLGIDVWWDHQLLAGEDYRGRILEVIERARVSIVLWSRHSVKSQFVTGEASAANARGALMPVKLDAAEPPLDFRVLHTVDLSGWVPGDQLPRELLDGLSSKLDRPVAYTEGSRQANFFGRTAHQITRAWYADFEAIIFYLIAQVFACLLQMTTLVYLAGGGLFAVEDKTEPGIGIYLFALSIGVVLAPLVMKPILENRRIVYAAALYAIGALQSLPAYWIMAFAMEKLEGRVLVFIGPSALVMILMLALGDRVLRR